MKALELIQRYNQGQRDFSGANLCKENLKGMYLNSVDLRVAYFIGSDLRGADLSMSDLRMSDLRNADLRRANLHSSNLYGAVLGGANFSGADLRKTDLRGVDLHGVDLRETYLNDTNLSNTCLDPMNIPNGECSEFEDFDSGWKVGYRTKHSICVGDTEYIVGGEYSAPVFSTSKRDCHPGLYVCPTIDDVKYFVGNSVEIVSVIFQPLDCYRAGGKYRVREFIVWEDLGERLI